MKYYLLMGLVPLLLWGCFETGRGYISRRKKTTEKSPDGRSTVTVEETDITFPPNMRDGSTATITDSGVVTSLSGVHEPRKSSGVRPSGWTLASTKG